MSPVVLLIGQHGISGDGLNTIQEGYGTEVFKSVSKWTHRSLDWNLHSYWVRKALAESTHYPPGPVVLEFPRNTLNAKGPERQLKNFPPGAAQHPVLGPGDPAEVERAVQMLLAAKRPVLIAGDGVYWSDGMHALKALVEFLQVPVHSRRTARGAVPENHPLAFTGGYRSEMLRNADVVCLVGVRATWLEEWFEPPEWNRTAKYIQIQETIGEIWPALPSEVAVVGACAAVLKQMHDMARQLVTVPPQRSTWLGQLAQARERFKQRQQVAVAHRAGAQPLHPHTLGASIAEFLDPSATVIYDSFTGTSYLTDKLEAKFSGQILDAGLHQPVGHGIGMCIGAQIARPGKQVLTLMGDGGFGISAMDMETMLRYKLPAVVVVLNNDSWAGNSSGLNQFFHRMDSTNNLPGVRYDRMFRELGCHTEHVEHAEEIGPALERSFNSGVASVINVVCDTTDIHPLRLRVAFGDTWSRGNAGELPPEAAAQLRSNRSLCALVGGRTEQNLGSKSHRREPRWWRGNSRNACRARFSSGWLHHYIWDQWHDWCESESVPQTTLRSAEGFRNGSRGVYRAGYANREYELSI